MQYDNIAQVYLILSDFINISLDCRPSPIEQEAKEMDMKKLSIICCLLIFLLAACSSVPQQSKIEVSQASVRLLNGDMPAAGYLLIKNTGGLNDRLLSVSADFADMLMLHKSSVDSNGIARMEMVMSIDVPAGQQVELKPGGFHILLQGLKADIKAGDVVTLRLQFEQAGTISVQALVTNQ